MRLYRKTTDWAGEKPSANQWFYPTNAYLSYFLLISCRP